MLSPTWMRLLCHNVGRTLGIKRVSSSASSDAAFRHAAGVDAQEWESQKKNVPKITKLQEQHSSWEERLLDKVTPLWKLNYEDQLKVKYDGQTKFLKTLTSQLKELSEDRTTFPLTTEGLCCPLHPVLPSPVVNGYRNKSTFSVNRGPDGDPKTVGYYILDGRGGHGQLRSAHEKGHNMPVVLQKGKNIVCVRGDQLKNMPEKHKQVARLYEKFIKLSPLDACLLFDDGGHWREITVRTNPAGHTMAIILFHPQDLSQEELCMQKESLKEFFTRGPGSICNLTSLYFQESTMTRCSHEHSPYQLLHGEPHIFEEVLGLRFRISPDAFFQVNTAGAELLYKTIAKLSHVNESTVFLDICCGTGAIGLSLASQVHKVLGIELVEHAVEDASWNAHFNGISNCHFHSGKAEVILPQLLLSLEEHHPIAAVVNPSRAGLHYRVTRAIRNCERIKNLVYVSCKPEGQSLRNFLELCCPPNAQKKLFGEPFSLKMAVPVDMFPHTTHCEVILLFER